MTFEQVLDQAIALLERRGRLTYRTLKRQFDLEPLGVIHGWFTEGFETADLQEARDLLAALS